MQYPSQTKLKKTNRNPKIKIFKINLIKNK